MTSRSYCQLHRHYLPDRYPVQPRTELATRSAPVVATRPGEELLCNGAHSGPHIWPEGDEVTTDELLREPREDHAG